MCEAVKDRELSQKESRAIFSHFTTSVVSKNVQESVQVFVLYSVTTFHEHLNRSEAGNPLKMDLNMCKVSPTTSFSHQQICIKVWT